MISDECVLTGNTEMHFVQGTKYVDKNDDLARMLAIIPLLTPG